MRFLTSLRFTTVALLFLVPAAGLRAGQIKYETTGVASGRLAGVPFTSVPFTLTSLADPTQVQDTGSALGINNLSTTIQLGVTTLTTPAGSSYTSKTAVPQVANFYYTGGLVGDFFDTPNICFYSPLLLNYDLKTPVGPLTPTSISNAIFQTNQGLLDIATFSQPQFTATTIPEPTLFSLLAAALFTFASRMFRRARSSVAIGRRPPRHLLAPVP